MQRAPARGREEHGEPQVHVGVVRRKLEREAVASLWRTCKARLRS